MIKKKYRGYVIIIGLILVILCSYINIRKENFQDNDNESSCEYVSSLGILKSCDIHSSEPVSSITTLKGYDFSKIKNGSTVYITGSAIPAFVETMKTISYKIILVSGDCDESIYKDVFPSEEDFLRFIEGEKIIHWFSQNCTTNHPKVSKIPIGLDYHTISTKETSWGPKSTPKEQEKMLKDIKEKSRPFDSRKISAYSNFQFNIGGVFGNERHLAIKDIPKDCVFYETNKLSREDTWKNQTEYAFVVSPSGNGLDCHRTWEALCIGCIPIIKSSPLNELFEDLPVYIVDSWADISMGNLQRIVEEFKNKKFNYDKLKLSFWMNKIRNMQRDSR